MISKETILALILSVLVLGSCKKDEIELPATPAPETIDSTIIPLATPSQPKPPILSLRKMAEISPIENVLLLILQVKIH